MDDLPLIEFASKALLAIAILAITWIVSRWAQKLVVTAAARHGDLALGRFVAALVRYGVVGAGVIAALNNAGLETTSLVAVLASAGLAIGLALQGTLSHFASGVLILVFRPFTLGDIVTAGGQTGRIDDIGLFSTALVTADNHRVYVPNGMITGGSIVNMSALGSRRSEIEAAVPFGPEPMVVREILAQAVSRVPSVLAEPPAAVLFVELGARMIRFRIGISTHPTEHPNTLHEVRLAVYEALKAAGVASVEMSAIK